MKVPLLDLKPQYQSLKKQLDQAVSRIIESQHFILGPEVEKMEKEFCEYLKCKHAVGVSSGTDALLLALMAIDLKPGDEVIVPTYSFFATAGVVSRLNAVPVFADIDPVSFNINVDTFREKITPKTKAVIPVHLFGQSAAMEKLMRVAKDNNLMVIEDAAQAIGTQYKDGSFVGTIGDIGCFSFFPSKNLGGYGDGGLVTTNNDELANVIRIKRVHGGEQKYYHKVIGGNFRIDALQAAVLRVKLPHLNKWSEKRRANAEYYNQLFIKAGLAQDTGKTKFDEKNHVLIPKAIYKTISQKSKVEIHNYHIYNQYIIRVQNRDELKKFLTENEIGNEIYYPVPFHLQQCFAGLKYKVGDFPEAEEACKTSLAIPVFPELTKEQQQFVVDKIKEFILKK
jgi:dTDP-4-amino-4,6-dideoxygalactose transaminase